jgi:hypothetical protein
LTGRSSTPRLLDSIAGVSGILGRRSSRAMTTVGVALWCSLPLIRFSNSPPCTDTASRSRRGLAREFYLNFPSPEKSEGAGNAGRSMRPRPRVRNKTKHTSIVTTVTPEITRHSPRNGFTVSFVLSPATNSSCHRHPRIKVLSMPGWATSLREFNTSNGCQNHTTSPSAAASSQPKGFDGPSAVRLRTIRQLTGRIDPPCHPLASPDAAASTASRPAFVTCARPSVGQDGTTQ